MGLDSHCTSSCTSSGKGRKTPQTPRKYWVFCFMHVRQSSKITSHKLLYTVLYIRTCICTGAAKKYCTKGVERFKFAFLMTCMTCILLWQDISLAARRQFAPADFSAIYPTVKRQWLRPPAPAICQSAFITWLICTVSYTNCKWLTAITSICLYLI